MTATEYELVQEEAAERLAPIATEPQTWTWAIRRSTGELVARFADKRTAHTALKNLREAVRKS